MQIKDMFKKSISRDIKGVIKVGQSDDENICQELEEYVVTNELNKHFHDFFDAYKAGLIGDTDKMGVWISGFFGSGKSHFLKILSYLLDNREVGGKRAADYFTEENKITDPMTLADIKKVAQHAEDTKVMLFNIDSKSDVADKNSKDAIVLVFLKVFNEMLGYCGSIPALAELERYLEAQGHYESFKQRFKEKSGAEWVDQRQDFDFIRDDIEEALTNMGIMSSDAISAWFEKATSTYSISIEEFASMVSSYIKIKGANHHVIFLVDEVGQYIGDNSDLMLNLQTVTEDLGTMCQGKAWVIVTSQQDIDHIVKDMRARASNDFSKIQGRFDTKISLTSANVDEVIRKRILEKNETADAALKMLYEQNETIIKNLIVFNDKAEKKLYKNGSDFAAVYPFVPYQFNLLASVLTSIRTHGASGKHLSEGERSMLALFKESAMKIMDKSEGEIVPFYIFYDALHKFLDHSHAGVILKAMVNDHINPSREDDCFSVNVLKALFMIKYVNEIEANVENLTSLMVDSIDADRIVLKRKVEESLSVLLSEKLIQKNGNVYVFLTDEEQEINREIDGQNIELSAVTAEIASMLFDDKGLIGNSKHRYSKMNGRYSFPYSKYVDEFESKSGQGSEIGLRIITPISDNLDDSTIRMKSGQGKEVVVLLPDDMAFVSELRDSMRIKKYMQTASSAALSKFEQIKEAKAADGRKRADNAHLFLKEALKDASIYVNGDKANIGAKEPSARIGEGLELLISTVFHKLPYMDTAVSAADIRGLLDGNLNKTISMAEVAEQNANALSDMLTYITVQSVAHMHPSLKSLMDRFRKVPYGFEEDDVRWLIAKLFADAEVSLSLNGENISTRSNTEDEIYRYLTKKEFSEKLLVTRRERVNEAQKKIVRSVMQELFHSSGAKDDDDSIMEYFEKMGSRRLDSLERLLEKYENGSKLYPYPSKSIVEEGIALFRGTLGIESVSAFYEQIAKNENALRDFAEDYDAVNAFFYSKDNTQVQGEQKTFFDLSAKNMEIWEESKPFVVNREVEDLANAIKEILLKKVPYSDIPKLPELRENFMYAYSGVLSSMKPPIKEAIEAARTRVISELDESDSKDECEEKYNKQFDDLSEKLDTCNNVATLQIIKVEADTLKTRLLSDIADLQAKSQLPLQADTADPSLRAKRYPKRALSNPELGSESQSEDNSSLRAPTRNPHTDTDETPKVAPPVSTQKYISIRETVTEQTWQIKNEEELDAYLSSLRERIKKELVDGKTLNIEF
ncbi:MAG: BREX system P-loop protein BrxC [Clostridiales Family XIII bacterium]|jgi:guanylate kinase|nr:BREX system P-loop protein BrxC [Clostridiales Family XIII bacterium]